MEAGAAGPPLGIPFDRHVSTLTPTVAVIIMAPFGDFVSRSAAPQSACEGDCSCAFVRPPPPPPPQEIARENNICCVGGGDGRDSVFAPLFLPRSQSVSQSAGVSRRLSLPKQDGKPTRCPNCFNWKGGRNGGVIKFMGSWVPVNLISSVFMSPNFLGRQHSCSPKMYCKI